VDKINTKLYGNGLAGSAEDRLKKGELKRYIDAINNSEDHKLTNHFRCNQCGACTPMCPAALDSKGYRPRRMNDFLNSEPSLEKYIKTDIDGCVQCYTCESACPRGISVGGIINALYEERSNTDSQLKKVLKKYGILPGMVFWQFHEGNKINYAKKELFHRRKIDKRAKNELKYLFSQSSLMPKINAVKINEKSKQHKIDEVFNIQSCCVFNFPGSYYSERDVLDKIGIECVTSNEVTCCGGAPYYLGGIGNNDRTLIGSRNLSVIEDVMGSDDIAVTSVCPTCYDSYMEILTRLSDKNNVRVINDVLSGIGRNVDTNNTQFSINHITEIFSGKIDEIKANKEVDLSGMNVRIHGSCHYKKWNGNYETLNTMKELVRVTGAKVTHTPHESYCCGGVKNLFDRYSDGRKDQPSFLNEVHKREFHNSDVDLVIADCPGCMLTYDQNGIPVMHIAQLLELSLGGDPLKTVRVQDHTTPLRPALEKVGLL